MCPIWVCLFLVNVFYCNYLAAALKRVTLFIHAFHVSMPVSDVYLNDLTHQQLSWKHFVQTQKNISEKGTRPSARLFFCLLQLISQLTYIYILHLLKPFKWGFYLHVYSGDFASCLTFIHSRKKLKEIHHKGFD